MRRLLVTYFTWRRPQRAGPGLTQAMISIEYNEWRAELRPGPIRGPSKKSLREFYFASKKSLREIFKFCQVPLNVSQPQVLAQILVDWSDWTFGASLFIGERRGQACHF